MAKTTKTTTKSSTTKTKSKSSFKKFRELIDAISKNEKTKVFFLLKDGIDVNATNENGRTPLMAAISTDDLDMVKILVEGGADLETRARDKETALLYACRTTENLEIVKYLVKSGADLTAKNQYKDDAFFMAAEYNKNWQILDFLLKTKAFDINGQADIQKYTPIMAAARYNNYDIINFLLDKGANLQAKDKSGWTPILHAAANQNDDPTNLMVMLRLNPDLLFERVGRNNLLKVAEDNHNPKIEYAIDAVFHVFLFSDDVKKNMN